MLIDELKIIEDDLGSIISLKVHPGAGRDKLDGIHDGKLKIKTHAQPEKGKANDAVIEFIAKIFKVSRSSVKILSGETSKQKTVHIDGVNAKKIRETLAELLEDKK